MTIGLFLAALLGQGQPEAAARPAEPTIMIVEFPRGARFIGFPRRCPGTPADAPDDGQELCLAELYEGPARVVRHLSGPRIMGTQRLRLTAHARRWRPGTRMIVATLPFEDRGTRGNFAAWWDQPLDRGDYCMSAGQMERAGDNAITRAFRRGYAIRFRPEGYSSTDFFRCIRGQEVVIRDL